MNIPLEPGDRQRYAWVLLRTIIIWWDEMGGVCVGTSNCRRRRSTWAAYNIE